MKKILTIFIFTCFCFFLVAPQNSKVSAATNASTSKKTASKNENLYGYALYVPAGITCSAVLSQEINSRSAIVGQEVNALLVEDFKYNGSLIAPEGSVIIGNVVELKRAGMGARSAKMLIKFTTIRTPYNNIIPINAVIATTDMSGVLKASSAKDSMKEYVKNVGIGLGAGAAIGSVGGAISKNKTVGEGAIYGLAIGATSGLIKTVVQEGDDIVLPVNSSINLFFNQPITLGAK